MNDSGPEDHRRTENQTPEYVDDLTIEAVGLLTEALETTERARGHLHSFHQLTGKADFEVGDAIEKLREAGHRELAKRLETELLGRNVLPGMWSFQILERYDDTYWLPFRELENQVRGACVQGRRHVHEAGLKESRRTRGHPDHTAQPEAGRS
ncbi:MAG TPA: hypothetical protein VFD59_11870 [Nocardioidaceae bacterium]|nr:hypothetical protein [Nocardioidaceae bacterium]